MDLQAAAFYGNKEIVQILLDEGADFNAQGGQHGNALQAAAGSRGNEEIVQILLDKGADVNAQGGEYGNALQAAAANGHKETVKKLLSRNASAKIESRAIDGWSLLHAAVASGNREILTALLDADAQVHISTENSSKQTPLHLAVISGDLQIVELLHPHLTPSDCNIKDVDGRTPLHLAVDKKAFDITKRLLESGASANAEDFAEVSPFELAFQAKSSQIPLLFLKAANDLPTKKASDWRSVLPGSPDGIIMLTSGELAINIVSEEELKKYVNDRSYPLASSASKLQAKGDNMAADWRSEKRMFILPDDSLLNDPTHCVHWRWWRRRTEDLGQSTPCFRMLGRQLGKGEGTNKRVVWKVELDKVPSAIAKAQVPASQPQEFANEPYEGYLECRVTLPNHRLRLRNEYVSPMVGLEESMSNHTIVWIMAKPDPSKAGPKPRSSTLKSKTFFSTLEYAEVPNTPTDLFIPMVKQLTGEWDANFGAAGPHLFEMRTVLLRSMGKDKRLINTLLDDARRWEHFNKLLEDQVVILRTLHKDYTTKEWAVLHEIGSMDKTKAETIRSKRSKLK